MNDAAAVLGISPTLPLKGKRVLVVEDSRLLAADLRKVLTDAGAKVDFAEEPSQAKQMLQKDKKYDLVILDMMLPKNAEALKEIRTHEEALKKCLQAIRTLQSTKPIDVQSLSSERTTRINLRRQIYDLIENRGGFEVLEHLKTTYGDCRPPVICHSCLGDDAIQEEAIQTCDSQRVEWLVKDGLLETLIDLAVKMTSRDLEEDNVPK